MSTLHDQLEAAIKERPAPPAEVYTAAARAYTLAAYGAEGTHVGPSIRAVVDAIWPLAFAAGRASIHTEWAASLAQDAQADDIEALRARVRRQLDDAEARGYARAVAALRDLDRYRVWLDTAARENGEPWVRRHSRYLEAVAGQTTPPPTEAAKIAEGGTR